MKKILLVTSVVLFFAFGLMIPARSDQGGGGTTVTCYSESRGSTGSTYWDCGDCTKQFNSKGHGASSTCTPSGNAE